MTYSSIDAIYKISFEDPGYDSCDYIPARAGCSEVGYWFREVEPAEIGAVLRQCLPLITDNQVADVIEALRQP